MRLDDVKIKYYNKPKIWVTHIKNGRRFGGYESEKDPGYVDESTVDKHILRLVKAINYIGISTAVSCEGHYDKDMKVYGRRYGAPRVWGIGLNKGLWKVEILKNFIKEYNSKNEIKWELVLQHWEGDPTNSYELTIKHSPKNKREIQAAKIDADLLAQYIYDSAKAALKKKAAVAKGQKRLRIYYKNAA